jgi:hypothetical protein
MLTQAILDMGSDCTLVPLDILMQIIEDTVILGRDVMRHYRIEFDGLRSRFEIF